jgi:4-amino-4-deoxy-L-arabinose transferase-like glycosyltransferase
MQPVLAWGPLLWIAAIRFAVPLGSTLFAPIGYTTDEFYYLACADHLAWGYVDHPPLSIGVLAAVRHWFGDSLLALRALPGLCESLAVLVTAALAREFGGSRRAQILAALAWATAPMALAIGFPFSMNPLEHLLWPLAALVLARIQNGAGPRWWIVLGLLLGLALENKTSTLWLGVGLAAGMVATPARVWLATRWPWLAAGLATAILAPHIVWQVANGWPLLEFVRNNAAGREGLDAAAVIESPWMFAMSQLFVMGPVAAPLWLWGLAYLLLAPASREHRMLGWTFAVVFVLLALSGRGGIYYLVGAFPIVFAAGGVAIEQFTENRSRRLPAVLCSAMLLQGFLFLPVLMPLVDVDRYLSVARGARSLLGAEVEGASLPPSYQWMLGGPELVEAVARVTQTLSDSERASAGVLATTFGEAGALAHFGPERGLPPVIGTHNNFWLWGTRGLDGSVMIVVAEPGSRLLDHFASCEPAARLDCPYCEPQLKNRKVFLCRELDRPLPELWTTLKDFV